jgi:hypothetical protein
MLSYRPPNGPENFMGFDSMLARGLFIISHPTITVLKQWEEAKSELERLGDDIDRMMEELPAEHRRILDEAAKRERLIVH